MHIRDILRGNRIVFSFEFFPPKNEGGSSQLFNTIRDLAGLKPDFVSVTYGAAGGSTRNLTHDLVLKIRNETDLNVVAHLTGINSGEDEVRSILSLYRDNGIANIMALRGDPPRGNTPGLSTKGAFQYASELVYFIKTRFPEMAIGVAGYPEGHPETPNRLLEMDHLKRKVDAGADYICTQMFFDNHEFYDFRERCRIAGITVPIIAGIMPITSTGGMTRMAELALGMRYPSRLLKAIQRAASDDYVEKVGIHWATEQVLDLMDNAVDGVHFYTLNKSRATMEIYTRLGASSPIDVVK